MEELASIIHHFKYVALFTSRIELDAMASPTHNLRELLKVRLTDYDNAALQEIEHFIVEVVFLLFFDLALDHSLDLLGVSRCRHLVVLLLILSLLLLLFYPSLLFHLLKGVRSLRWCANIAASRSAKRACPLRRSRACRNTGPLERDCILLHGHRRIKVLHGLTRNDLGGNIRIKSCALT